MKFRPCIDIHDGKVKQIVGSSLSDEKKEAKENFVSQHDSAYYAKLYKEDHLTGGHVIMLNSKDSESYKYTLNQAIQALHEYPKGLQIGGGIHDENALFFIKEGASHVIVTSYVFQNGIINYPNLERLVNIVGKDKLVLDLSCRRLNDEYYVVTDRWQKFTKEKIEFTLLDKLSDYCSEFLIHAVDVEGKCSGMELPLVRLLGEWNGIPITYAGGISTLEDIQRLEDCGNKRLDFTVGSALDIFGGKLLYEQIKKKKQ